MIELRDYQLSALGAVRVAYRANFRAPLLVSPTGSGKTHMFSWITRAVAQRGKRVMILVHRQELLDQVSETLENFEVPHGVISPQYASTPGCPVQVASVFTLVRRLAQTPAPDLIIIDEAHHAISSSTWGKVLSAFPRARLLGVTATPQRLSGEGLGDTFDTLIQGPTVQRLIDGGHLAPVRVFAPPTIDTSGVRTRMGDYVTSELQAVVSKPSVMGDAISHYHRHTPHARAAVFCVSLAHANSTAEVARKAGINAVMIDGKMHKELRRDVIEDFKAGRISWLVSVDLLSEGFDCPGIDVGIFLRPTQSLGLWLQQCGRILRTHPGKTHATILDHAGNSLRHGLPTEDRTWSLDGSAGKHKAVRSLSVRVCPQCFSAQRSGKPSCFNCGAVFKVESRPFTRQKGDLEELTPEKIEAARERRVQGMTRDLDALIRLGVHKYGPGKGERWAQYVYQGRQNKKRAKA